LAGAGSSWRLLDAGLPLQTLLLASYLGVFLLPLGVMAVGGAMSHELLTEREEELRKTATLVTRLVEASVCPAGPACAVDWNGNEVRALLEQVRAATGAGVRVVDTHGIVIATSGPRLGADLSDRDEVRSALGGSGGTTGRTMWVPYSTDSRFDLRTGIPVTWAVATEPLELRGQRVGALVLARPTKEVWGAMGNMARGVGPRGLLLLALGVVGLTWASWRLSRALTSLATVSSRLDLGPQAGLDELTRSRVLEVRKLAIAFAAVTERLRARVAYNRDLAATVAHEFKTPLTTLRGVVELLDDPVDPPPPDQVRVFLDNARTDLDRLSRMVTGLLALARAEEQAETELDLVDLDAVLADARCPVEGRCGQVRGQREGWAMVVRNLVENALAHGAEPVRIDADDAGFDVVDSGPGISPANLAKVFDRFFTTGNHREGTGLGLAIVRATLDAYGATIDAVSRPGETRFRVRLPVTPPRRA